MAGEKKVTIGNVVIGLATLFLMGIVGGAGIAIGYELGKKATEKLLGR